MFVSALIAGSALPFASEAVLVLLVGLGLDPVWCLVAATAGNTLGGMTCYWIGRIGKTEWIVRYLHVSQDKLERAMRFLGGRGAAMGFFAFLPYIGTAVAIALGLMRSNQLITALSMLAGKALRYAVIAFAIAEAL